MFMIGATSRIRAGSRYLGSLVNESISIYYPPWYSSKSFIKNSLEKGTMIVLSQIKKVSEKFYVLRS